MYWYALSTLIYIIIPTLTVVLSSVTEIERKKEHTKKTNVPNMNISTQLREPISTWYNGCLQKVRLCISCIQQLF